MDIIEHPTEKTGFIIVLQQHLFKNKYLKRDSVSAQITWTTLFDDAYEFDNEFVAQQMLRGLMADTALVAAGLGIGTSVSRKTAKIALVSLQTNTILEMYRLVAI